MATVNSVDENDSSSDDDYYNNFEKYKKIKMEIAIKNEKAKKG